MGEFVDVGVPGLLERVGDGRLQGTLTIDQVYARYQHERLDLNHPMGGKARYLADPLVENYQLYFQDIADSIFTDGPIGAMSDAMDRLSSASARETPRELFNLSRSHAVTIRDQGAIVRRREPQVGRLSERELRELKRGRRRRGSR